MGQQSHPQAKPWCSNGVFSSEIYIHKQLLENTHGVRTFDPEEADFFCPSLCDMLGVSLFQSVSKVSFPGRGSVEIYHK